jgi:high-affinity nickel-transport protein
MLATIGACALGVLFGLRHALDPDHLAAVATLVERGRGAIVGVLWGIGHALALLVVGVVLAIFQSEMPPRLGDAFELLVAVMLVLLGARALWAGLTRRDDAHGHSHAEVEAARSWSFAVRPLVVGMVHGLAGSGALTALVLAQLPTLPARILYTGLFGLGTIGGMVVFTTAAGAMFRWRRSAGIRRVLGVATGALSAILGIVWGWPLVAALL